MNNTMQKTYRHIILRAAAVIIAVMALAPVAKALSLDHYAAGSVLASGRWVKVAVPSSGLYKIPVSTLRSWGFSDPSRVRVFGYGGRRIADILNAANYVDDLPQTAIARAKDGGIVFYGVGPEEWTQSATNRYTQSTNLYTEAGYYFIGESDESSPEIETIGRGTAESPATDFVELIHYEQELVSPGEAGPMLVGEDFRFTPTRKFSFTMPDKSGDKVWFEVSFVAKTYNAASQLTFNVNGTDLTANNSDRIAATSNSVYVHATEGIARHETVVDGQRLDLTVTHKASTVVYSAWLNYISVNYQRELKLPAAGHIAFRQRSTGLSLDLSGADASGVTVWDVTEPSAVRSLATGSDGGSAVWTNPYSGLRSYVAWRSDANIPAPTFVSAVSNQNLHGEEPVNMVIFTHPAWKAQAERIAEYHRSSRDALKVKVVDVAQVYNEFASGMPDVSALRKYLKMLYDRGAASDTPLRYALIMARTTYDERHQSAAVKKLGIQTIPAWQVRTMRYSLNDNDGFNTDDFIAMLEDNSGSDMGLDDLSIAVGRIPVTSASEAAQTVDKIYSYAADTRDGAWKNRIMMLADDEDNGVHLEQAEKLVKALEATEGQQHIIQKVYMDAYTKSGGAYPLAREEMFRYLNEGVVWWCFAGHANNHAWTHDKQLTFTDLNEMYLTRLPYIYAATCDFLRWDSNTVSGGELLFFERYGGAVGMISATRPVYITDNGFFSEAMGRALARRDDDGRLMAAGEIYRRAKNDIRNSRGEHRSNPNRLRYVFMGDPALRPVTPDNIVVLDSIDGKPVGTDSQVVIAARSIVELAGHIESPDGTRLDGFDGTVGIDIYDADRSVTSNGNGDGKAITFEVHGDKLYSGSTTVTGGEFKITVATPSEIADNFREATLNMYATSPDATAVGVCRDFYVYGLDEEAADDDIAPVIESLVINHPTFVSGDRVNADPMVIARIIDNVGINLSTAGVGHQMTITLDGNRSYNDVPYYFTPSADGTASGEIAYPLSDLTDGPHTIMLRVWDTHTNSATKEIDFVVDSTIRPKIYDIYSDANPASVRANFYLVHNRPNNLLTVTVSVYNLNGKLVWSDTSRGMSDMYLSSPVSWDLTDQNGARVKRGIYVYRASISTDGDHYETDSRKIAVTAE